MWRCVEMKINYGSYFDYAMDMTKEEIKIQEDLLCWLPNKIIDSHVHCGTEGEVLFVEERTLMHMASTYLSNTVEQSKMLHEKFFAEKNILNLKFPFAPKGIDHKKTNDYLQSNADKKDRIALYGIPDDIEYTITSLRTGSYSALKMYYSYFNPSSTKIYEYFKPEILEVCQQLGLPIILHLPSSITKSFFQIQTLINDFPYLKIVIAHMGLQKIVSTELLETYDKLKKHENVFFDNAMIPSAEILTNAVNIFGSERILYGSDEPLNMIRVNVYNNPKLGERYISDYPYHWLDKNEVDQYRHLSIAKVSMLWKVLVSMKESIQSFPSIEEETIKNRIFYNNAKYLFGF